MKDTLKNVLFAFGPSGREDIVRAAIEEMIRPYVDEIRTDALGNLIATKKGAGKRVMMAAHMDQIGFVITDIDEKGFLRVFQVGGIRRLSSLNRHVVFENGVHGVLSNEVQAHDPNDATLTKMFIDIGATSREDAMTKVKRGDMAVYVPEMFECGEYVSAPAMDNRAGCALLIEAIKRTQDSPHELVSVFTTQEEVGLRGAIAAAYGIAPDIGIALDVTPTGDTPKGNLNCAVELNKGIAVKVLDSSLICTPWLVEKMERAAESANITYQREVLTAGGTDAGAIQRTRGGVPSGVLSIPCRYVHSATEMISMKDMAAGVDLLVNLLSDKEL